MKLVTRIVPQLSRTFLIGMIMLMVAVMGLTFFDASPAMAQLDKSSTITLQEDETGFCSVDGTVDDDHFGFTGDGFANTTNAKGKGITWKIDVDSKDDYMLKFGYANGSDINRTADLLVDGDKVEDDIDFEPTNDWDSWAIASVEVKLKKGIHKIRLKATTSSGLANIDQLTITGEDVEAEDCDDDDDDDATCDDPDEIETYNFSQNGSGEYCWETPYEISYVNSWETDAITINGVDYTNQWSNSMPDPIDGMYYIHYEGSYEWSHLEVIGTGDTID